MNKINLKKQLTIFGKPCQDEVGNPIFLSESIANCLIQGRSSQPAKMMSICVRLHDTGELDLDDQDLEFLRKSVEGAQNATDLLVASVLKEIEEQVKKAA